MVGCCGCRTERQSRPPGVVVLAHLGLRRGALGVADQEIRLPRQRPAELGLALARRPPSTEHPSEASLRLAACLRQTEETVHARPHRDALRLA
jgi:hypothetical protein